MTTGRFLEVFGLASLRDLPDLERLQDGGGILNADAILDREWGASADGEITEEEDDAD